MTDNTVPHNRSRTDEDAESSALAAALSVHYIVMALYTLATLLITLMLTGSLIAGEGDNLLGGFIMFAFLASLLTLHFLAVKGLRNRRPWGRLTSKGLSLLLLLAFPFGTVLGIILLSQLSKFSFSRQ